MKKLLIKIAFLTLCLSFISNINAHNNSYSAQKEWEEYMKQIYIKAKFLTQDDYFLVQERWSSYRCGIYIGKYSGKFMFSIQIINDDYYLLWE